MPLVTPPYYNNWGNYTGGPRSAGCADNVALWSPRRYLVSHCPLLFDTADLTGTYRQPYRLTGDESCGVGNFTTTTRNVSGWAITECSAKLPFICKTRRKWLRVRRGAGRRRNGSQRPWQLARHNAVSGRSQQCDEPPPPPLPARPLQLLAASRPPRSPLSAAHPSGSSTP
jgi:hypothetical protein